MPDALLSCENLTSVRGGRVLWQDLSFALAPGDALLVTGTNGSGKSSLLRVLAGLLPPSGGMVKRTERYAYLGHDNALKAGRMLGAELAFWGVGDTPDFGLAGLRDVPVSVLSAGQKRRAALWRTCGTGADLWLLDEPEAGLDAANRTALLDVIDAHRMRGGVVVVVSHADIALPNARGLAL